MANESLKKSRDLKNDEFYTFMNDIENEISTYDLTQFKDKVIYCNCDDPTWSSFFKFFVKWGKKLGIKEAHFTNFANTERSFGQITVWDIMELNDSINDDKTGIAHHWVYNPSINKVLKKQLKGNGDFRSEECLNILKKSDIVVTNPPFSLLTEFLKTIIDNDKKFLIIGNENEIASRSWCSYFMQNKIWFGYNHPKCFMDSKGKTKKLGFACWYTNLEVSYRESQSFMILHPQDISSFEKYDNYNAIEIPKTKLIPDNYFGNMGVPISFLEKYNPHQFEIVDTTPAYGEVPKIKGKKTFRRIIIRRKK